MIKVDAKKIETKNPKNPYQVTGNNLKKIRPNRVLRKLM
jgi:hypothetical protein